MLFYMLAAHIEVAKHSRARPEVMYDMLVTFFEDVLGREQLTVFEHSYDKYKRIFRFDLTPLGELINLLKSPIYLFISSVC